MTTEQVKLKPCPDQIGAVLIEAEAARLLWEQIAAAGGGSVKGETVTANEAQIASGVLDWVISRLGQVTRTNPPSPDAGKRREAIAKLLCDDIGARLIANQVDAPNFDKSAPHVQAYWRALAAALSPAPDADTVMVPRAIFDAEMEKARTGPSSPGLAVYGALQTLLAASQVKPDPLPAQEVGDDDLPPLSTPLEVVGRRTRWGKPDPRPSPQPGEVQ